ncbi:phytanoyl-CoA dioxygenase family protein [Micromonospora echinofusca]|uniref:phytanoyl-CoA dioxygenase family protein n=1 Tax=Micromonospora echinofusca TaxID=47858 RepID=UPI000C701DFD|nr:phytanoyl-CoA dioxygenase family protein [Micromonospora sp. MSM11]MCL7456137.1 phytanoyl-CoA dioxygenase family protein [Micromonospora sp. MSM11]
MSIQHAEGTGTAPRSAGTDVPGIREVTRAEIERFWEDGWVRLPRLIDPALVGSLLRRAQQLMGPNGDANEERLGFDFETSPASQSFRSPSEVDDLYERVVLSRQLGRNAALLLGRDHAQRFFDDILLVKLPLSQRQDRGQALGWHQDKNPTDRSWIYFWIPLDHVSPEQGAVRYLTGSHKLGPLWRGGACVDLDEAYRLAPRLRSCRMSEEMSFEPGDVMAHCSWVVHGTDANVGTQARWVYRPSFLPADAVYMGVPSPTIAERGIKPFEVLDHPDFPVVYEPAAGGGAG